MLDLTGEWIGFYPGHFDEVIRVDREDAFWVATKITGDEYVPAGEITWRAEIASGEGSGQIAGVGFRNPTWVPGRLTICHADRICFTWNNLGTVDYRRDA
ncbi:MAG: hypothetical protein OHK005_03810 [Candidatus Methylacidiphilales bacterium]